MNFKISRALEIAADSLRKCYAENGILAGRKHFDDYWARDGFFASLGACALGDYEIVKKQLKLFLSKQKTNGEIPLRIGCNFVVFKMLGLKFLYKNRKKEDEARYIIDRNYPWISGRKIPSDQNSMLAIAFENYCRTSGDWKFARENYEKLRMAVEWNFTLDTDGDMLIEEGPYCSWLDTVKKSGKVLYTECLHYWACLSVARVSKRLKILKDYKQYSKRAEIIRKRINSLMWNGKYYTDWISEDGKRHEFFSTEGNFLAVMLRISDGKKDSLIISKLAELGLETGVPYRTNHPSYGIRHTDPLNYVALIPDYHDGMSWLWIGCLGIAAKTAAGKRKNAMLLAEKISDIVLRDGDFFEVYERRSGLPVNRIFYKSERPFAWAAGMFIYAIKNYCNKKKEK